MTWANFSGVSTPRLQREFTRLAHVTINSGGAAISVGGCGIFFSGYRKTACSTSPPEIMLGGLRSGVCRFLSGATGKPLVGTDPGVVQADETQSPLPRKTHLHPKGNQLKALLC